MADVVNERFTELVVRIVEGSDPVRGEVGPPQGPSAEFIGWSEFAASIEQFRLPDDYAT
jgi:hypothetical protein